MDINKAKENLDQAYQMLGKIPVLGDSVDYMAAVRGCLRRAWSELEEETKEESV